ncbi:MAG: ABC transporter permease, partial [Saprospiraceae bacterium]|nr:ABC transporter permease [Saprospiraceae bacterium]
MWRNHINIAIRTLTKKRLYSILNIGGLALGIAAAILIWQYVAFERSYDQFHPDWQNTYRLHTKFFTPAGQDDADAMNAAPVGPALKSELPEVLDFVRITPEYGRTVFSYGNHQVEENKIYFADSNFLRTFNYSLLYGDKNTALLEPFKILLTKSTAEHYFGPMKDWTESPVGKTIRINNKRDYTISAIAKDLPSNTHFKFNGIISFSTFPITNGDPSDEWEWNDFYTYIRLNPETKIEEFQNKLDDFSDRHLNLIGTAEYKVYYGLQPIHSIHLKSNLPYEMEANGDGKSISFLMLIAILILIIAWANYINLTTARAEERSAEIGVRKVIGAGRGNL